MPDSPPQLPPGSRFVNGWNENAKHVLASLSRIEQHMLATEQEHIIPLIKATSKLEEAVHTLKTDARNAGKTAGAGAGGAVALATSVAIALLDHYFGMSAVASAATAVAGGSIAVLVWLTGWFSP